MHFRISLVLILAALLFSGCASNTVEKRRAQRSAAYSGLSADDKAAVDAGQVKIGMSMDAVYIAWGKPTQIARSEGPEGAFTTWLYYDTYLQSYTYWAPAYPYYGRGHYYSPGPRLNLDYMPVPYVRREVVFEKDVVKQWRTLPAPGY